MARTKSSSLFAHALLGPDTNIVVSQYCFAIYPIVAKMFGADVITVPAKNYGHDLAAMLKRRHDQDADHFRGQPE